MAKRASTSNTVMSKYIVEPNINGDVTLGEGDRTNIVFVGRLAETGAIRNVYQDVSKEFVSIIIGQRGSGKSFSLGAQLESLCTVNKESSIGKRQDDRGVLLLDPNANFWTSAMPVRNGEHPRLKRQYSAVTSWHLNIEDVAIQVWTPAGCRSVTDHACVQEYFFDTSDFTCEDWAQILDLDTTQDAPGQLLSDTYYKLQVSGWHDGSRHIAPGARVDITALINCLINDSDINTGAAGYQTNTISSLKKELVSLSRRPLFANAGTPLTSLIRPGVFSILMLPYEIGRGMRSVLAKVIINKMMQQRREATKLQQRLDFEETSEELRADLRSKVSGLIPRTILAIDEAQELLGDAGGDERAALEDYCLRGRGFGLSMILATQRPESNALSAKVASQADTWYIHSLGSQGNISTVYNNLVTSFPESVSDGRQTLDFYSLLRSLKTGQSIVAAKSMETANGIRRVFVMDTRPRVRIHGGDAS